MLDKNCKLPSCYPVSLDTNEFSIHESLLENFESSTPYDNMRVYQQNDLVTQNNYTYKFIAHVGGAGYGPSGSNVSNAYWTFIPAAGQSIGIDVNNLHGRSVSTATPWCNWTSYAEGDYFTFPSPPLDANNNCSQATLSNSCTYLTVKSIGGSGYKPSAAPGNFQLVPGTCESGGVISCTPPGNLRGNEPIQSTVTLSNGTIVYLATIGSTTTLVDSNGRAAYYTGNISQFTSSSYLNFLNNTRAYSGSPLYILQDGSNLLSLCNQSGNLVAPGLPTIPVKSIGYINNNTIYLGSDGTNTVIYQSANPNNSYTYVGPISNFNPSRFLNNDGSLYTRTTYTMTPVPPAYSGPIQPAGPGPGPAGPGPAGPGPGPGPTPGPGPGPAPTEPELDLPEPDEKEWIEGIKNTHVMIGGGVLFFIILLILMK